MASKVGGRTEWSGSSDDSAIMNPVSNDDWKPDSGARGRGRIRMARMEADMAYFQARIELIGEPCTSNQSAQRKLFRLLHQALGGKVLREKQRQVEAASPREG